jgi:hypothetical protein
MSVMAYFNRLGREGPPRHVRNPLSGRGPKRRWHKYTGAIAPDAALPLTNGQVFGADGRERRLTRAWELSALAHF